MRFDGIKNLKMKYKLFISYLAVIIIPLGILGVYSYQQSKQLQIQQANIGLQNSLMEMEDNLNYKLQRYDAAIELIGFNPNLSHIFNDEYMDYYSMYKDLTEIVDPLINTTLFLNDDIKRIIIYTGNNLTERIGSILPISQVEHTFWFQETMGDLRTHWYSDKGRIFGARRIFGNVMYDKKNIIYLELKPEFFSDSLVDKELSGFTILVTDENLNIIYSNDHSSKHLTVNSYRKNKDYILLEKPIGDSDLILHLVASSNSLTIKPWKIIRATIIIEAVSFVGLLLIIWLFSSVFVRRIYRLNNKMKMVEQGVLTMNVTIQSRDEIGELEERFGKMLASINQLIDDDYKNKIIQKEAELKALHSQINPHFLYNSLSVINWKAIQVGAEDISQVAGILSAFYRTTLNKGKDIMSVEDELLNTKSYIEMQLIMHDHNFDVHYHIEDELLDYNMIKLVLQPIVENAIEHGIDQKRDGRGTLIISATQAEDTLLFSVEDNGPGMNRELIDEILVKQSKGYGLYNVQERIRIQYGGDFGIFIESELGKGTKVIVKISKILYISKESHISLNSVR